MASRRGGGGALLGAYAPADAAALAAIIASQMDARFLAIDTSLGGKVLWTDVARQMSAKSGQRWTEQQCQRLWRYIAYGDDIGARAELLPDSDGEDDGPLTATWRPEEAAALPPLAPEEVRGIMTQFFATVAGKTAHLAAHPPAAGAATAASGAGAAAGVSSSDATSPAATAVAAMHGFPSAAVMAGDPVLAAASAGMTAAQLQLVDEAVKGMVGPPPHPPRTAFALFAEQYTEQAKRQAALRVAAAEREFADAQRMSALVTRIAAGGGAATDAAEPHAAVALATAIAGEPQRVADLAQRVSAAASELAAVKAPGYVQSLLAAAWANAQAAAGAAGSGASAASSAGGAPAAAVSSIAAEFDRRAEADGVRYADAAARYLHLYRETFRLITLHGIRAPEALARAPPPVSASAGVQPSLPLTSAPVPPPAAASRIPVAVAAGMALTPALAAAVDPPAGMRPGGGVAPAGGALTVSSLHAVHASAAAARGWPSPASHHAHMVATSAAVAANEVASAAAGATTLTSAVPDGRVDADAGTHPAAGDYDIAMRSEAQATAAVDAAQAEAQLASCQQTLLTAAGVTALAAALPPGHAYGVPLPSASVDGGAGAGVHAPAGSDGAGGRASSRLSARVVVAGAAAPVAVDVAGVGGGGFAGGAASFAPVPLTSAPVPPVGLPVGVAAPSHAHPHLSVHHVPAALGHVVAAVPVSIAPSVGAISASDTDADAVMTRASMIAPALPS